MTHTTAGSSGVPDHFGARFSQPFSVKVLRCDEHDLQAIEAIHRHAPLDASLLVRRSSSPVV